MAADKRGMIATLEHLFTSTRKFSRRTGHWDGVIQAQKTDCNSQRENWHAVSSYVAEFWCTLSSIPIIAVALYYRSAVIFLAGFGSFTSHMFPFQFVHHIDMMGVAAVVVQLLRYHMMFVWFPQMICMVFLLGALLLTDTIISRQYGITVIHIVWHLSIAMFLFFFYLTVHQWEALCDFVEFIGGPMTLAEAWSMKSFGLQML